MRFLALTVVLLCMASCSCALTFDYEDMHPFYVVGSVITENKPNPPKEGSYTVSPDLPDGLSLDSKTGYISGTPTVQSWTSHTIVYNAGQDDQASCILMIVCMSAPVVNCGVSKLTTVSLINTVITCTSTGDASDDSWSMTPKEIRGVSQDGPYLTFRNFNPQTNMKITIEARNDAGTGSFDIDIVKVENPELKDGIFVTFYDLETTKCGNYYDGIPTYEFPFEAPMNNLDNLTNYESWIQKMQVSPWGIITTFNGTMDGFINIETAGDYTFYMQTGNEMNARVFIDDVEVLSDWSECKPWNDDPMKKTVKLESGYRRVIVDFMGGEGLDFKFVLDYSTAGSSIRKTIPFKYYYSNFNPVMFLSADTAEVSWKLDAFSLTPIHVSKGKAESCWISNNVELPEGSEVTVSGITGHPQSMMDYTEVKIKCKNQDSETNEIALKLRVTDTVVNGVRAYYYKPYNFDTSLYTKYGPEVDGIDPLYIQRQDRPSIVESQEQPHPDGLSIEFLDDYGVYWEGYLYPTFVIVGLYNFKVIADGGYWVYFNHKEVLAKPGRNTIEDEGFFDFNMTDDDYLVQIYYVSHNGHATFKLLSKLNTADEDEYRETNMYFHYVPVNDYFLMTQSTATYLNGQTVKNQVIAVEKFGCKSIVIDPPLPNGLREICSGSDRMPVVITGVPDVSSYVEMTAHKIKVTSTLDKSISTTIYISVKTVQSPADFYVIDLQTGKEYTDSISLVVGEFYDLQFHVKSGYVIEFRAENIPVGFTYDWKSSTLSGSPREKLDTKVTVTAVVLPSDGDNKQFEFGIKAEGGCESGKRHSFHFSNDFVDNGQYLVLRVTASNGTRVMYVYETTTVSLPRTYSMCLPVDTYTIYISGMFDYVFTVYNDGVRIYRYTGDFPVTDSHTVVLNTDPVEPNFKYITNNATYYQGNQILLIPTIETFVDYFTITPSALPRGIRFNNITGRIYGTARFITNATTYTITAINDKGRKSVEMIIHIIPDTQEDDCENAGKFLIGLTLAVGKEYDRPAYQLINSKDEVVFERVDNTFTENSINSIKMCITKGWYTLRLIDISGSGWGNSNMTIYAGNSIIGRYTVSYTDNGEVNITTDFTYLMDTRTQWQYNRQYVPNWEFKNFTLTWPTSPITTLAQPPLTMPTYYLRYPLSFPNYDKYSGYFLRIKHRSGVIVRVNGRVIFRDNLPSGDIGPNTPGDTAYERAREENFILPIDDLNDTAIITYEIHKSPTDDNFPNEDRFFIFPLDGDNDEDCILVTLYGGSVSDSSSKSFGKYESSFAHAAFDLSVESSWDDYYGTVDGYSYADYTFGSNSHYTFNQFTMRAGTGQQTHYPMKVSLTGKTDTSTVSIGSLDPVYYFETKKYTPGRATFNVDPYTLYKSVRIDIPKSNQYDYVNKGMEVREIGYHLCRTKKCVANPTEKLPEGISNTFYKANCSQEGAVGERYFYCSNFALWIEVNSTCGEVPKFINTELTFTFDAGVTYVDESIYEVTGNPTFYSFSCPSCEPGEFIPGLKYNTTTGLINGTPYKGATYSITFTATNQYGSGKITMTLIIKATNNIIIWKYMPAVVANVYEEIDEQHKQIFWVESASPVSYSVNQLPFGIELDSSTGFIKGKATRPGMSSSMFTISNTAGQSTSRQISFLITIPNEPVMVESVDKLDLVYMMDYDNQYPILCYSNPLTYSIDKNLPASLTYNATTGAMKGKVTASAQSAVSYKFSCTGKSQTVSKDILVSVIQGDDIPVVISQNESVILTTGQELFNERFFTVSGSNLVYSITPTLPSGITMDSKTGTFNGYGKVDTQNTTYTINVSNGKNSIQIKMLIVVVKSETPVIPDSTVKKDIEVATGTMVSIQLFDAVGDGLSVSINPPLPDGFVISASGYLQGLSVVDVSKQDYVITVTDSNGKSASVTIKLEFKAKKCPANDGFPETLVGDQAVIKCGGGRSGFIMRRCIYVDGNAIWESPIDECSGSTTGALVGIIIGCIILGGVVFLGGYCIYVRVGGRTKHVRKTAEQMVDASKDAGVRI